MSTELEKVDADLTAGGGECVEGVEVDVGCDGHYDSVVDEISTVPLSKFVSEL